jgi:hypothetical protein
LARIVVNERAEVTMRFLPPLLAVFVAAGCAADAEPATRQEALGRCIGILCQCYVHTDTSIAASQLQSFAPRPYVDPATQTMEIYVVTTNGLYARRFWSQGWHNWASFGVPAGVPAPAPTSGTSDGWDTGMAVVAGPTANQRDVFFGYTSGSSGPAVRVRVDLGNLSSQAHVIPTPSPHPSMSVGAGAMFNGAAHVFGESLPNGTPNTHFATLDNPIEHLTDVNPTFVDHAGASVNQFVGPGALVQLRRNPAVDMNDSLFLYAANELHEVTDSTNTFVPVFTDVVTRKLDDASWTSLGAPAHVASDGSADPGVLAGQPYAFGFYWADPSQTAAAQMNVFAVARDAHSYQYRLFGRGMFNGNLEPAWTDYGVPPTVGVDEPFNIYAAMVYWDGPRYASNLRTNLWGLTRGGKLIEFYWDGGAWQWGQVIPTAPDGAVFTAISSTVVDQGSYKRQSLFARTATGRIYEYSWVYNNGTQNGWNWLDLTLYNPCTFGSF